MLLSILYAISALSVALASPEQALLDWVVAQGGQVHLSVVDAGCSGCGRGAVATKAFDTGDVIVKLPARSSVDLGSGGAAEQAYRLLERVQLDPVFSASFGPYLESLPGQDEVFTPVMYTDEDVAALQCPQLERLVRERRGRVERLYRKKGPGPAELSLQQLKHMAAVIGSRNFWLLGSQRLVPVFDMLNHSEDPNTEYTDDGKEYLLLRATRPIAEGEVLTDRYMVSKLHRGDASLFHYGYLPVQEWPLLCSVDLPDYNPLDPWAPTDPTDDYLAPAHDEPQGLRAQQEEFGRLAGLLASMPTSERQDRQLLQSGSLRGWQQRLLVQFRLQRKRALRLALEGIERDWAAQLANLTGAQPCLPAASGNGSSSDGWLGDQGGGCLQEFLPLLECPALELSGQSLVSVLLEATSMLPLHGGPALWWYLFTTALALALAALLLKPWVRGSHHHLSAFSHS